MSRTPLNSGPLNIAPWIKQMQRPSWKEHPILQKFMGDEVRVMGNRWKKAILKIDSAVSKDITELQEVRSQVYNQLPALVETLFVCSTTNNKIDNHPVVEVPKALYCELLYKHNDNNHTKANEVGRVQQEAFDCKEAQR